MKTDRSRKILVICSVALSLAFMGCGDDGAMGMPDGGGTGDAGGDGDGGTGNDGGPGTDAGADDGSVGPDGSDLCQGVDCIHGTCAPATGTCACDAPWMGDTCSDVALPTLDIAPVLWLDAADTDTLTFDDGTGDALTWTDKSSSAYVFEPAAVANGPSLDALGTRPALAFDGVNDHLATDGFTGLGSKTRYTIFFVASVETNNQVLVGHSGDTPVLRTEDTTFGMSHSHAPASGTSVGVSGFERYAVGEPHLITIRKSGAETSVYVDGGYRWAVDVYNTDSLPASVDLTIGDDTIGDSATDLPLDGRIGEIVVYDDNLSIADREQVEDYLYAKWFDDVPFHDETSVSNTVLLLDAADEDSFTLAGDNVSGWNSRVRDYSFTQSNAAGRPMRVADGLNGMPVVRFDGSGSGPDNLYTASPNYLLSNKSNYTVVVVAHPDTDSGRGIFYGVDTEQVNSPPAFQVEATTLDVRMTHREAPAASGGDFTSVSNSDWPAGDWPFGEPFRFIGMRAYDAGTMMGEMNGDLIVGSTSATDTDATLTDANIGPAQQLTFVIGGTRPDHAIDAFKGDVAEIIVFERSLSFLEMEHLKSIIDAKWGFGG